MNLLEFSPRDSTFQSEDSVRYLAYRRTKRIGLGLLLSGIVSEAIGFALWGPMLFTFNGALIGICISTWSLGIPLITAGGIIMLKGKRNFLSVETVVPMSFSYESLLVRR